MQIEKSDYGFWVRYKAGRSRYIPFGTPLAERIEAGLILDGLDKTQRAFAQGTHEHMVLYRDENGLNIPPDPSMVPAGAERIEIKSLAQADAICREMRQELRNKFSGDSEVTAYLDDMQRDENGNTPREYLAKMYGTKGDKGREIVRHMLSVLDREESDREKISADFRFAWRES